MKPLCLLIVAENYTLPGLGVLLLATDAAPSLAEFALHTALVLELRAPQGKALAATGSVEEIAHGTEPLRRALLLTHDGAAPVPAGTQVWWSGAQAGW